MRKGGKSLIMRIYKQSYFFNIACNHRSGTLNALEDFGHLKTNLKTLMNARFPFSQLKAIECHPFFLVLLLIVFFHFEMENGNEYILLIKLRFLSVKPKFKLRFTLAMFLSQPKSHLITATTPNN